jgi:hypothetical protein
MGRSGSATSRPGLAIWSPWIPSMLASPEGVGPVWQLTAVDTATHYAIGALVAGDKSARDAVGFVDHVAARLARIGVELAGVLTDYGPEFTAKAFTSHLAHLGVGHHRIPPRSPNPQRGLRALPRDRPPGVLPARLPPPALCSPGRPQRPVAGLAAALQHPPPQPRRLHARPRGPHPPHAVPGPASAQRSRLRPGPRPQ